MWHPKAAWGVYSAPKFAALEPIEGGVFWGVKFFDPVPLNSKYQRLVKFGIYGALTVSTGQQKLGIPKCPNWGDYWC